MLSIVRRDPHGAYSHPLGGRNLVPHQRQQRRDQERRSGSGLAQQPCRNEVDDALSPPRPLHDEKPSTTLHNVADSVFLPVAELGIRPVCTGPQQFQTTRGVVPHGIATPSYRRSAPGQISSGIPSTARRESTKWGSGHARQELVSICRSRMRSNPHRLTVHPKREPGEFTLARFNPCAGASSPGRSSAAPGSRSGRRAARPSRWSNPLRSSRRRAR